MRHPHPSRGRVAQLTVVDDNAVVLRSLAADRRFFSAQLWFAAWGYSTPQQQAFDRNLKEKSGWVLHPRFE